MIDYKFEHFATRKIISVVWLLATVSWAISILPPAMTSEYLPIWLIETDPDLADNHIARFFVHTLGLAVVRVALEILAVVFTIADRLREIRDMTSSRGSSLPHSSTKASFQQ